jgi:predicted DNA-binding protein
MSPDNINFPKPGSPSKIQNIEHVPISITSETEVVEAKEQPINSIEDFLFGTEEEKEIQRQQIFRVSQKIKEDVQDMPVSNKESTQ